MQSKELNAKIIEMSKTSTPEEVRLFMKEEINRNMQEKISELRPMLAAKLEEMELQNPMENYIKNKVIKSLRDKILSEVTKQAQDAGLEQAIQDQEIDLSGIILNQILQDVA
jgi:predicted membrane protein